MKELSLHILDIAKNSVKAGASLIEIAVEEDIKNNLLTIDIDDNGCGMTKEFLKTVKDPFSTTRTTRKVGMGISLFEAASIQCGGGLDIDSEVGKGTKMHVYFEYDSIDRAPLGDVAATMQTLITGSPEIDFLYRHIRCGKSFMLDTRQMREILGDVSFAEPEVSMWIYDFVSEGLSNIGVNI